METLDRPALMRKTMPDLVHIMRRLGGDSQPGETKDSLIHRILLFAPQQWKEEPPKIRKPIAPVTEDELKALLKPYMLRGMKLKIEDGNWFIAIRDRRDSGTLSMPAAAIERCAKYLMPKDV